MQLHMRSLSAGEVFVAAWCAPCCHRDLCPDCGVICALLSDLANASQNQARWSEQNRARGSKPRSRLSAFGPISCFAGVSHGPRFRVDSMLPADCGDDGFLRMFQPFSSISTLVLGILGRASVSNLPGMLGERPASCVTCAREGSRLSSILPIFLRCALFIMWSGQRCFAGSAALRARSSASACPLDGREVFLKKSASVVAKDSALMVTVLTCFSSASGHAGLPCPCFRDLSLWVLYGPVAQHVSAL